MSEPNVESLQQRLQEEISKNENASSADLSNTELLELKAELFTAKTSIKSQEIMGKQIIEAKEKDLMNRIKTINALETNIAGMDQQLEQIIEAKEAATRELETYKTELSNAIGELIRLNKLMESINQRISDKIEAFQMELDKLQDERTKIFEDFQLSPEEKEKRLAELNVKIAELKGAHKSALELLDSRRNELESRSKTQTESLTAMQQQLTDKYNNKLKELELRKENASPSEIERIEAEIEQLKTRYDTNIAIFDKLTGQRQYFFDTLGRYYVGANGEKIYQQNSLASEYILNAAGEMTKLKDVVQTDEIGDYFLNELGEKVYTRTYATDEHGLYYTDDDGRRVYCVGESRSEYLLVNGVLVKRSEVADTVPVQSKTDYIKEKVGVPLRKALAAAVVYNPNDPIDYIADYLLNFRKSELQDLENDRYLHELTEEREKNIRNAKNSTVDANENVNSIQQPLIE